MIEKPKRPKQPDIQERQPPRTLQELINRYDLDNTKIYDFLDELVEKEIEDNYYKSGNTYSTQYIVVSGMITTGATYIALPIYLPKRLDNITSITVNTLKMEARGIKGYLNSNSGVYNFKADSNYSITAQKRAENLISINITKSSAFTNVDNNTPVVFTGEIGLTFN